MTDFVDIFGGPAESTEEVNALTAVTANIAGNPRDASGDVPVADPYLGDSPQNTLVEEMARVIDDIRTLHVDYGTRAYRMLSVVYRWSGDQKEVGVPVLVSERELWPRPRVNLAPVNRDMVAGGSDERGNVLVSEVSVRYTEDELTFKGLNPGEYGFFELLIDSRDGTTVRRRLVLDDVPHKDLEKSFEWRFSARIQDSPRNRDGTFGDVPSFYPERFR